MKKVLAIVCIVAFSLMVLAIPRSLQQNPMPAGDYAYLFGQLAAAVLIIGFLFFSVRWYLTLSGHTYKVKRAGLGFNLFGVFVYRCTRRRFDGQALSELWCHNAGFVDVDRIPLLEVAKEGTSYGTCSLFSGPKHRCWCLAKTLTRRV